MFSTPLTSCSIGCATVSVTTTASAPGGTVAPVMMLTMTGYMVHSELETFRWSLTGVGLFGGLVLWSLIPGITVWLIAAAYNRMAR